MSIDKAGREPLNKRERFWISAPSRESQELSALRPEIERHGGGVKLSASRPAMATFPIRRTWIVTAG